MLMLPPRKPLYDNDGILEEKFDRKLSKKRGVDP